MSLAELIVGAGTAWLIVGGIIALVFLLYGADRILEDAREVYLFRVLAAPGIVLIWPIVLWRWYLIEKDTTHWPDKHTPKRKLAGFLELAMSIALIVLLAIAAIGLGHSEPPEPVKLSYLEQALELGS